MNMGIIIAVALLALWALGVFLGAIGGLSKPFKTPSGSINSSALKSQERKKAQETEEKRERMMEDLKQKMRDAKRY